MLGARNGCPSATATVANAGWTTLCGAGAHGWCPCSTMTAATSSWSIRRRASPRGSNVACRTRERDCGPDGPFSSQRHLTRGLSRPPGCAAHDDPGAGATGGASYLVGAQCRCWPARADPEIPESRSRPDYEPGPPGPWLQLFFKVALAGKPPTGTHPGPFGSSISYC
jgi:hypothetical protein